MGKTKRDSMFFESSLMNNRTYLQYYNRLTELAISMFEWKNLPNSVDARFLELTLFGDGQAVFFRDDDLDENGRFLALRSTMNGGFDVYGIPLRRRAFAVNGYQKDLTDKDSVLIYNNYLHLNSMLDVEMFSRRLYNLDRAIDVNANAQKTPILLQCDETELLSLKNLYKKYEGNEPFIFGAKGLDINGIKCIQTGAPYVSDKLYELKTQIWNEALTYLGISNVNTVKKERMITDEVLRNNGGTIASRYSRLESRKQACRKINEMFGLNIDVEYREDMREFAENTIEETDEEREEGANE